MEIEIVKPTSKQAAFQALFNMTDKEAIVCLVKEIEELDAKIEAWEKCADSLVKSVQEYLSIINYYEKDVEYNKAEEAIKAYNKLKDEMQLE